MNMPIPKIVQVVLNRMDTAINPDEVAKQTYAAIIEDGEALMNEGRISGFVSQKGTEPDTHTIYGRFGYEDNEA